MSSVDILWTRGKGVLQMRTSALFDANDSGFFEIYCASTTDKGNSASADVLRTREEGVNYSRFCAYVLYGRPLTFCEFQQAAFSCAVHFTYYVSYLYNLYLYYIHF